MKIIVKLLVLLVFLGVTLGVTGYFLVPPAAKKAVDEGSRYAFGVPATIGSLGASPGLGSTSVGFENYVLASPAGFDESLLSIGKFNVGVGTKSLFGDTKDVGAFVLEDVRLTLVQNGIESNLLPVLRHLQGLGGEDEATTPSGPREGAPGPKLRIGDIRVEGISAVLKLRGIPGIEPFETTFDVPAYTTNMASITGTEGKTVAEIAGLLVQDLKERALTSAEGVVPAPVLSAMRKTLDGGLEGGLKGGLDAAKDALGAEALQQLDAAKKQADEALGGAVDKAKDEAKKAAGGLLGEGGSDELLDKADGAVKDAAKEAAKGVKKGLGGLLGGDGK